MVSPTAGQRQAVSALGAHATWNQFGTPRSLIRYGGFLGTVQAPSAARAARLWLDANSALFRLDSADGLVLTNAGRLTGSRGNAVLFEQRFGDLRPVRDGQVSVGVVGSRHAGWKIAYVSSSLTGDSALGADPVISAQDAWLAAAEDIGRGTDASALKPAKADGDWTTFGVAGIAQTQRARLRALPTPVDGVRPVYETYFVDVHGGSSTAFQELVDAETGDVLVRQDIVDSSHPPADVFTGSVPKTDGACATNGPWTVADGETAETVAVAAEAQLGTNDIVLRLVRDGSVVASQDTATSPEALVYSPPDEGTGTYEVQVCDFGDGAPWDDPATYSGEIAFSTAGPGTVTPYPPKWKAFPANPLLGAQSYPWDYADGDIRQTWCWETTVGAPPVTVPGCDRAVINSSSRAPWDVLPQTGATTFTTLGNNANSAEAWTGPLTPGATSFRPYDLERDYSFPWTNAWHASDCLSPFVPGESHDIQAAVTNLFAMHNRMHDWSYALGFDERRWNAQASNFGTGGTAEHDPVTGDAQAGAADGGFPSYEGRDNANMISLPDGVPAITNMYLFQPLAGAFYAPCVDGDFDMSVIGHEYGHMIENRMIGKGGTRAGFHAGAMGEANGDLLAEEYLHENGFVPVDGEGPYVVGAYVTGNHKRGIRDFAMNWPRTGDFPTPGVSPKVNPLNFGDIGFDVTGPEVHADGEIWVAVNYDVRNELVAKYNAAYPASNQGLQTECAEGRRPANLCPGNRRWAQIMFDAYLLMPVAPSMLDARDAYLAADVMRFGGANQREIWRGFARRGFGAAAQTANTEEETDTDPRPDFSSPLEANAKVTFAARSERDGSAVVARFLAGQFEARVSPIADTDPATSGPNFDGRATFAPGTYEFVVQARGYGEMRIRRTFAAGGSYAVSVPMPTNWASRFQGASAAGDGDRLDDLIDDTESTNWERTGADPDVAGSQVTVNLAGGRHTVRRVNVSAMLGPGQNRFTALRSFEILVCTAAPANGGCTAPDAFTSIYTSPANAFPGVNPRPTAPDLILRGFDVPDTVATHVQIRVLANQCTGNASFQGEQDADPLNGTDCRDGSPGSGPVTLPGDLPQVLAPRGDEVHIAELQVYG
jgi:hypothetical protein